MEQQPSSPDRLAAIARAIRSGEEAPVLTVRSFLQWFGAQRRGYRVVEGIRKALSEAGLRTEPDFESAWIDREISLVLDNGSKEQLHTIVETTFDIGAAVTLDDHFVGFEFGVS